jgi:hypothetical protein
MDPRTIWPEDPIFIELGVRDTEVAACLRKAGYERYLGLSGDPTRIANLQANHPEFAQQLTCSRRRKLVLNNNAEVLILSGRSVASVWRYRSVRHAKWVAWPAGIRPLSLFAFIGCLWHMITKRYSWPRIITLQTAEGKTRQLCASRVLRQKSCRRDSLHFIPHRPGLSGMFQQFDEKQVRYVVLRWFERLPEIEPAEDVDLLVADRSLSDVIEILESLPGIQPCDVYSESGLARSAYRGTPYYPPHVARRILDCAVRHNSLCKVPNDWDYFHSLAYHAVYHKGLRSNLSRGSTGLAAVPKSDHDFSKLLAEMAGRLGIDVDVSLEGLDRFLQLGGWGPPPEMLARLATADWRNDWLQLLAKKLAPHVHDQGLAVFVIRREAVRHGFQDQIIRMIRESGFDVLAIRELTPSEVEFAAARTRGGNWTVGGPFDLSGGEPAVAVVAYDRVPMKPNRKQLRRFPQRTNARIFVKESIRDAIIAQLPPKQGFNALHSSDHAAEAWHLIEVLAPEMVSDVRARICQIHDSAALPVLRRAA